jgi:6-phospho-3-hexuloisomerase
MLHCPQRQNGVSAHRAGKNWGEHTLMSKQSIIDELRINFMSIDDQELETACDYIIKAPKIFVYARGRVGVGLKAFCMRLNHLGLCSRFIGDITTPAISAGDLLIVGSSLGFPSTIDRYIKIAKDCKAHIIAFTSNRKGPLWKDCTALVTIVARAFTSHPEDFKNRELTDVEKHAVELLNIPSEQPMCSTFEQLILLTTDYLVLKLQKRLNQNEQQLRARHANIV